MVEFVGEVSVEVEEWFLLKVDLVDDEHLWSIDALNETHDFAFLLADFSCWVNDVTNDVYVFEGCFDGFSQSFGEHVTGSLEDSWGINKYHLALWSIQDTLNGKASGLWFWGCDGDF